MEPFSFQKLFREGQVWLAGQHHRSGAFVSSAGEQPNIESVPFQISSLDGLLPKHGLCCRDVHEFLCEDAFSEKSAHRWNPSLLMAAGLMRSFLSLQEQSFLVWMGRRCFPTPHLLQLLFSGVKAGSAGGSAGWQEKTFFLHSREKEKRLWILTQLLKSPAPIGIVADGSKFSLLDTRRLQLACEQGRGKGTAFFLLLRPSWERDMPSTAQTRWLVSPALSVNDLPRCSLELLRAKGRHLPAKRPAELMRPRWTLEVQYEKDTFCFREVSEAGAEAACVADPGREAVSAAAGGEGSLSLLARHRF